MALRPDDGKWPRTQALPPRALHSASGYFTIGLDPPPNGDQDVRHVEFFLDRQLLATLVIRGPRSAIVPAWEREATELVAKRAAAKPASWLVGLAFVKSGLCALARNANLTVRHQY